MNEYTLNVDIKRDMTSVVPTFAQDNEITLYFRVFDNGKSYDYLTYLKSEVTHKLPSGKIIKGSAILVELDGKKLIKYDYSGVEMIEVGYVKTNLTIYTYSTKLNIRSFNINIYENMKLNIN